jgi:tetratricopeptide (TPR) repeat protein
MAQLDEAATCAQGAIKCQPDSHQPYTLMGAICYDIGEYEQGNEWFEKAIERGAEREEMEDEIKRVLRNARDKTQQREAAQYLLNRDPVRYAWAQSYLN